MKNNSLFIFLSAKKSKYVFISLNIIIFLLITTVKSYSKDDVFTVTDIEVIGDVNVNFSREKYLNKAFKSSFEMLMNKILLKRELKKVRNIELKKIKNLINRFQIIEESYSKDEYKIKLKIFYDGMKVKKFLGKKNISFSQPEKITVMFYPVFFINGEIQSFNENYFYRNWGKINIKNEVIKFLLPLEDLEDFSKIIQMKNDIEKLDVSKLINKYDITNYVFTLIDYQNQKLSIHMKTNFNNKKVSKNILYQINNLDNAEEFNSILKNLKLEIIDIWKEENLINLLMPLSIKIKFEHTELKNLDDLKKTLPKINIIDDYILEEFNINNSFFKIYYFGDPKKLKSELLKFGYDLKNVQGKWQLYLNE